VLKGSAPLAVLLASIASGGSAAAGASAAAEPAWSPDGTRLAYAASGPGGRTDVFVADVDGSGRIDLTADGPAAAYGEPSWSRDGRRVAYVSTIHAAFEGAEFGYVVARADGSTAEQVATSPTVGIPSFSPDGRYLAFDGFESVWVARTDGSGARAISAGAGTPIFSPRTDRVAFVRNVGANGADLFTSAPDGRALRRLTTGRPWDIPVAWARGGSYLLFATDRDYPRPPAVYAMRADGSGEHRVGFGREADFSPGAARVVFVGARGGLWIARLNGHGLRRLVPGEIHQPRWSPDGRWIAYTVTDGGSSRVELVHPDGSERHVFAP
jgi:Tol biopolymer transport system component